MSEATDLIEMAREEFDQVKLMDEAGVIERKLWSSLYYVMFYAANGALLALGHEPTSHRGVNVLVGKVLYKERSLVGRSEASFYSELRRLREDLDYSPYAVPPDRDLTEGYERVEAFVDTMEAIVEESPTE